MTRPRARDIRALRRARSAERFANTPTREGSTMPEIAITPDQRAALLAFLHQITVSQAEQLADLLAFLVANPTHHVQGYVKGWERLPDPNASH
jgi:hypothetical protein